MPQGSDMNIESLIRDEYNRVTALARELFPTYASRPVPYLDFFHKGRTAGWAKSREWRVEINTHIAAQNLEMMKDTVSHEIAHMVCFATGLGNGHNAGWKRVHRMLGGSSSRTYCAKTEGVTAIRARSVKEFLYAFGRADDSMWVGPTQHKRIQTLTGYRLRVKACGSEIAKEGYTGEWRWRA